jgi:hypothetical protein
MRSDFDPRFSFLKCSRWRSINIPSRKEHHDIQSRRLEDIDGFLGHVILVYLRKVVRFSQGDDDVFVVRNTLMYCTGPGYNL